MTKNKTTMKHGDIVCYSLKAGFWKVESKVKLWIHGSMVVALWRIKTLKTK